MKKQLKKKLSLNKATIVNIENGGLNKVKGGAPVTYYCTKPTVCPTFNYRCGWTIEICEM